MGERHPVILQSMATLSESLVQVAKPKDKLCKLLDERGLYLRVERSGGRLWRFRYHHGGKEKLLSLGSYADAQPPELAELENRSTKCYIKSRDRYVDLQGSLVQPLGT